MRMEEVHGQQADLVPPKNVVLEVEGRFIEVDEKGFLIDHSEWTPAVAEYMAAMDEVELGDDHWLLINFLHRFYDEYEIAPELRVLSTHLCKDQHNCRWTRDYVLELFPDGAKSACRYAGLPFPVGKGCV